MLRRHGALGLRGRIVGALLITTVATLGVAALALLSPLEHQLRTEAQTTLINEVRAERGTFTSFTAEDIADANAVQRPPVTPAATALPVGRVARAVVSLSRRSGADVSLWAYPQVLIASNLPPDAAAGDALEVRSAFATGRIVKGFASSASDVAQVAAPLSIAGRTYVLTASRRNPEIPGAVKTVEHAFIYAALAGIALTLILGIPLAATLLRRLQRLRTAALRLAQGAPTVEVPLDRAADEVGDLTRTFGIMQRRLAQQEQARRAFVSTASHELRTPLASLHGMLELLEDELEGPAPDLDDARRLLARARAQSRRLGRLAGDLLDLSRLDAEVELRSEPVELGELSRAVIAEFELGSAEHGIVSRLEEAATPVWALGDPGSVAQILRILLDNAVQLTAPGTEVTVTLRGGKGPVAVSVSDHGPGVAEDERELIFKRFHRGRERGGSAGFGLGLAIGRELAERMGGELVLEEPGEAPGATFTLRLPAAPARDQDAVGVH